MRSRITSFRGGRQKRTIAGMNLRTTFVKVIVSARLGKLRIAPHLYNSQEDVDCLIKALPV